MLTVFRNVRSSFRSFVTKLVYDILPNKWTNFAANWYKYVVNFWVRRSKLKVTRC